MARSFKRPDEAAMQRVFARTSGGAAEVVLRLAWLQGLHRAEITALTQCTAKPLWVFAGSALGAGSCTVFFGGSIWDGIRWTLQAGRCCCRIARSLWIRLRKPACGRGMCAAPEIRSVWRCQTGIRRPCGRNPYPVWRVRR